MAGSAIFGVPRTLVASAVYSSSSNTGNLKNTAAAIPVFQAASIWLSLTASSSPTTLDVIIETSPDGGTTWLAAWEFTQLGAVATGVRRLDIRDTGIGFTEVGSEISAAEVNNPIKSNAVVTTDLRVKWVIAGTSYTFAVYGIFQSLGTQI